MEVVVEIVNILLAGLTTMATGIGSGLTALAEAVFVKLSPEGGFLGLTTFGQLICSFGGVAMAVGLSTFVVKWVMSLGARK